MTPDRLERAVDALIDQAEDSYLHRAVLALLRREQRAQRARVVKIVKAEQVRLSQVVAHSKSCKLWIKAKQDVLIDILAKLHGRAP